MTRLAYEARFWRRPIVRHDRVVVHVTLLITYWNDVDCLHNWAACLPSRPGRSWATHD